MGRRRVLHALVLTAVVSLHTFVWCTHHQTTEAVIAGLEAAWAFFEAPVLGPAPDSPYDVPVWSTPKVHRDHHVQVHKALYSVPGDLIGQTLEARRDSRLVKLFHRGAVVKVHPALPPGRRSTDPDDLPSTRTVYALRDLDALIAAASRHGGSVEVYARRLLDDPLPWTRMRTVYRLIGLAKRHGSEPVDAACAKALECEVVDVGLIERIISAAGETTEVPTQGVLVAGRFARQPEEFRGAAR